MVVLLLLNAAILSLTALYAKKVERKLKEYILTLEITSTVFNLLLGLFLLFGFMENYPTNVIGNLIGDLNILFWLMMCFLLTAIHAFFSVALLRQLIKKSQ